MHHARVAGGRNADRHLERVTEQLARQVGDRHVAEQLRVELAAL